METEVCQLAKNLARNCGYYIFPCLENKSPATPRGFYDASNDPAEIETLWRRYPGPLIGVRAGEASGISILDVDVKHESARAWWIKNEVRLPATRTFRTRGGGLHLLFQHAAGVRNSEGNPVEGIDTRGQGGYFIYWFAHGYECLDHSPPAPWPAWLSTFFWPPPKPRNLAAPRGCDLADKDLERVKQRAIDRVREAGEGQRHFRLRSSARLLGGIQRRAGFSDEQAIEWLAGAVGLGNEKKACNTIEWGLEKGRAKPLEVGARHG